MIGWVLFWCALLFFLVLGQVEYQAQVPTVENACQLQVEDQYRQLVADRILPAGLPSSQQLTAIASKVRTLGTEYEVKQNQEKLAVSNVADLMELRRRLQQELDQIRAQNAALSAELEKLKAAQLPASTPSN